MSEQQGRQLNPVAGLTESCKVCGGRATLLDVMDFGRQCCTEPYPQGLTGVPVYFHRCSQCGFVFTTFFDEFTPEMWRRYVYNDEYERIDPEYAGGRPARNAGLARAVARAIKWKAGDRGCDFGGGSGVTASLLCQRKMQFDSFDPYGASKSSPTSAGYRLITAFEVLEHSVNPAATFRELTSLLHAGPAVVLASTSLANTVTPGALVDWWYAAPRNGHVSLFTEDALMRIAAASGLSYRRVTRGLHLFGRNIDLGRAAYAVVLAKIWQKIRRI